MLLYPNAKINLGLHVLRKRPDGFHDLDTAFFPLFACADALELIPSPDRSDALHIHDRGWTESPESNLVWKAMLAFRTVFPELPPLHWHIKKGIPTGAGLGGGSSDAAFALRMMARLMGISESDPRLFDLAAGLGSDCAFFLLNKPAIGSGRGEILEPLDLDLSEFRIEWVYPQVHISTAQAFSRVVPREGRPSIRELLSRDPETWKQDLVNDFEDSVFSLFPDLAAIKEGFYQQGATYASLSGSGSALFGLFRR